MSGKDTGEMAPRSERWERSQQSAHWRDIGISAVAAAARYGAGAPGADTPLDRAARPAPDARIVTLRDIEFFAA